MTPKEAFLQRAEPLWIAALGVLFVVLEWALLPRLIQLNGRAGQTETVESAIYMSLLLGYPPVVWLIARILPRHVSHRLLTGLRLGIVAGALVAVGYYMLGANAEFLLGATLAAVVTLAVLGYDRSQQMGAPEAPEWSLAKTGPLVIAGAFAWMCAGGIISWSDAPSWFLTSLRTAATLVAATALTVFALPAGRGAGAKTRRLPRSWDYAAIAVLTAFSFRTFPMVEYYDWGFYIGPIEQLRQGGRLLWDTPSQYGFLSVLIPALLPGNAWVSFWFYQSVIFAVVAALMYAAFRQLGSRWTNVPFAFAITFTTLFFQPRNADFILPTQVTPSGGPVRFLWCFVLLAFIIRHYFRSRDNWSARSFALGGTGIWLVSILWSVEGAMYCSAIWLSSYTVFIAQQVIDLREQNVSATEILRRLAWRLALPVAGLAAAVILVALAYLVMLGTTPDWRAYLDYTIIYSREGSSALPVDPSGSVWYLLLLFLCVSTAVGMFLASDPRDRRLVVLAGLWGGAWSVGSYFVGRRDASSALSLAPFLLYSAAIALRVVNDGRPHRWHRLLVIALIPAFAMPLTLTLGHAGFRAAVSQRQLPLAKFKDQLPVMDSSMYSLLRRAGARPDDPFVLVADGRLLMPAWPKRAGEGGARVVSERSWLPKPFEVLERLPVDRRQKFIDRSADRLRLNGWLVRSTHHATPGNSGLLTQIERNHHEERRMMNENWLLSWMAIGPASERTPAAGPPRPNARKDSATR